MKEPIEELFKKSLDGHEMSYRPEAWNAMRSRLDATSPIAAPRSYTRYYIAAAGIGIAVVASYFIFTQNDVIELTSEAQIVQNDIAEKESTSSNSLDQIPNKIPVENHSTESTATKSNTISFTSKKTNSTNSSSSLETINGFSVEINTNPSITYTTPTDETINGPIGTGASYTPNEIISEPVVKAMLIPTIPDICVNERILIGNTNQNNSIMVLSPNGKLVEILPGNSMSYISEIEGIHGIGFMENNDFYSESTFNVLGLPTADFSIDEINKFTSGIPTTHVVAGSTNDTYTWKASGQIVTGPTADIHFYKKGKQTITLTVSNDVCSATAVKSIYIQEDYNLMAVTAFNPLGSDPRNMTFMPFALTERNVNFNMVIIDSKDGGVVYKTSDSDQPWNGTDIRTGERDRGTTTYIWKVVLYNPELNEPVEYLGTVTKL